MVLDLTSRLAALEGVDPGPDIATWYRSRFGEEPNYSTLLERFAATPAERRDLLRRYFEPTEDEREQGLKQPTPAHRAIAELVASGYVRVVITTNFDQLLETAIREAGVTPAVIASADAAFGAMPLQHERVTVVKLHGDYLDTRIRNTPQELASYEAGLANLLDRILDEYGLVICGWSGAWDEALRTAIMRCPTRRFTTFWAVRGELEDEANKLVEQRRALVIPIESADSFFGTLAEKVASLNELQRPHPVSTAVAVAALKRYLPVPEHRIRLHDLVMGETDAVVGRIHEALPSEMPNAQSLEVALSRLESASATLMALVATGAYWGQATQRELWVQVLERLGALLPNPRLSYDVWRRSIHYPAQLALYSAGMGAVARGTDDTLIDLLLLPRIAQSSGGRETAVRVLHVDAVVPHDWARRLPGMNRNLAPMADRLHRVLREPLRDLLPDDEAYDRTFDRLEYLLALTYAGNELDRPHVGWGGWAPIGRLAWRWESSAGMGSGLHSAMDSEIESLGVGWLLLRRGLFDGSTEALMVAKRKIDEHMRRRGRS